VERATSYNSLRVQTSRGGRARRNTKSVRGIAIIHGALQVVHFSIKKGGGERGRRTAGREKKKTAGPKRRTGETYNFSTKGGGRTWKRFETPKRPSINVIKKERREIV